MYCNPAGGADTIKSLEALAENPAFVHFSYEKNIDENALQERQFEKDRKFASALLKLAESGGKKIKQVSRKEFEEMYGR
jgi:hypothetical protein